MSDVALLEFQNISKTFGSFVANDRISFKVSAGSIHGLVGENGAGKSTLMNILFGMIKPDEGILKLKGQELPPMSPHKAKTFGIGMVHQHFVMAKNWTPLEHLIVAEGALSSWSLVDQNKILKKAETLSQTYLLPLDWTVPLKNQSVEAQQRFELLKVLFQGAEILILDEPTAVLSPNMISDFLKTLIHLKSIGKTILLISHKLPEILSVCDEITVLRKGKVMGSLKNQDLDIKTLTQLIVGKEVFEPKNQVTPRFDLPARLRFESVSVNQNNFRKLENISFKIHPYEILGIAGIENSGQSEIVDLLVNRARLSKAQISGKIFLSDTELDLHKTQPYPLSEIALLPMDRQAQGLFGDLNLAENYLFASHSRSRWQRWGWLKQAELQKTMQRMLLAYDVRVPSPYCKASQLSGGNQQKFVVGRELDLKAKLLLACHPTRGVDVSAKAMIHQQILQFQSEANSVLLISSDLDELQNLCNRILVFYQNQIIGEVTMPCHDPSVLGQLMTGVPL